MCDGYDAERPCRATPGRDRRRPGGSTGASSWRRSPLLPPQPVLMVSLVALVAILVIPLGSAAGLSLTEARSILDAWQPEVHGAVAAKSGDTPYQVSIRLYSPEASQHRCGGAIISAWHVLTAARCISYSAPLFPDSVFVVVGSVKRSSLDNGDIDTVVRKVDVIARHPAFSSRNQLNDLAVLTLNQALPVDRVGRIATIPLPAGDIRVDFGTTCIVSGWGNNTSQSVVESDALLTAEVPFVDRDVCKKMYEPHIVLQDGVVCTAHQKGGVGACVGDPGGPLSCNGFLAGIVSWGSGCGANSRPTVYTSIMDHVAWVRGQMAAPRSGSHSGTGGRESWAANTAARTSGTVLVTAVSVVGHILLCRCHRAL